MATIWKTFSEFSMESISMPRAAFARELSSAVRDRDHASFLVCWPTSLSLLYTSVCMRAQDLDSICSGARTDNRQLG